MTITLPQLLRWSGLAAVIAGLIYAGIQPIHPPDELASLNTTAWSVITPLKVVMSILFLLGLTGLYLRQAEKAGWLGLAAFLVFGLSWSIQTAFIFAEAFIMPPLAAVAPTFIDGFFGIVNGQPTEINLGALPTLFNGVVGGSYLLGGLLFGVATFRAGVLPRLAGALMALTALLTPLAAFLPHATQRLAAVPMGLALAWMGYALWTERRALKADALPGAAPAVLPV